MARCGCASDRCSCTIVGGNGTSVTGNGSQGNPYVVEVTPGDSTIGADGRFVGEIVAYGGTTPPTGWVGCLGQAVSRSTYSALFSVIGVQYGAGDGATTFNVPDLVGRFPLGVDGSHPRGTTGGASTVTVTNANLPSHTHSLGIQSADHHHAVPFEALDATGGGGALTRVTDIDDRTNNPGTNYVAQTASQSADHTHAVGATAAGSSPLGNMPPYNSVNYVIKV